MLFISVYSDMLIALHCDIVVGKLLLMRDYEPGRLVWQGLDFRELTRTSKRMEVVLLFVIFSIIIGLIHISQCVLVSGMVNKQR